MFLGLLLGAALAASPEATSLLGQPLFAPELPPERRAAMEADLARAREAHERAPDDPDALIWLGRRTAYLGRYREAVAIFSRGVERWPEDARFLRHRGHRRITLRHLDEAVADLARAAKLIEGRPDEVEPDGQPNAAGIPTSTLHTNVWYHLGLAHFLKAEFRPARDAFDRCLTASRNDDMRVAARDWLYMSLRRLGKNGKARKVLEPIRADLPLLENFAYLDRLLLYRGERSADELLAAGGDDVQVATHGFGVGHWHLVEGRPAEAEAVFRRVVAGRQWAAFGFIAAEAELARLRPRSAERFELVPVERVAKGALHFELPRGGHRSQPIADQASLDGPQGVEVRDAGARESLVLPQGHFLRDAAHRGRDLGHQDLDQVLVGRGAGQKEDRPASGRVREVRPTHLELPHRFLTRCFGSAAVHASQGGSGQVASFESGTRR